MGNLSATDKTLYGYVSRTLNSGVKPFDLLLTPVYDLYYGEVVSYRGYLKINSIVSGTLMPKDYLDSDASDETLVALGYRAIEKILNFGRLLKFGDFSIKWLSVKVPPALLYDDDLYENLKKIIKKADGGDLTICLEFLPSVMKMPENRLIGAFSDIKANGLKVAVEGYGGKAFSMEKLLTACPDVLFLDPVVAKLATDREKKQALAPIVNLPKTLGALVVADGIKNDDELREFRARDVFGFIPDNGYKGALDIKTGELNAIEFYIKNVSDNEILPEVSDIEQNSAVEISQNEMEAVFENEKSSTDDFKEDSAKTESDEDISKAAALYKETNEAINAGEIGVEKSTVVIAKNEPISLLSQENREDNENDKEKNTENNSEIAVSLYQTAIKETPDAKELYLKEDAKEPCLKETDEKIFKKADEKIDSEETIPTFKEESENASEHDLFVDTANFSKTGRGGRFGRRRK